MAISTDGSTESSVTVTDEKIAGDADVPVQQDPATGLNDAVAIPTAEEAPAVEEVSDSSDNTVQPEPVDKDAPDSAAAEDSEEPVLEEPQSQMEPVRTEEVQALLGGAVADDEEPETVPEQNSESVADAPPDDSESEYEDEYELEGEENTSATDLFQVMPDNPEIPEKTVEPDRTPVVLDAVGAELKNISESLQDSLANTRYISAKIDAVSDDTDRLAKQVNGVAMNYELLAAEMESFTSSANTKSILSKSFLVISSLALILLVIFQIYEFFSLIKTQRLQYATGSSVLNNISSLNKKLTAYDRNLTKAMENQAQQEQAKQHEVAAEATAHEAPANKDAGPTHATPVLEKLNKLRNGLPEKKLIRKETGDWFVINMNNEESISDIEVIEVLNQAYRRIGRSLTTNVPMPSNNALCILKPDGKGGTEVVMTKDFLPTNDIKPEPKKKHK